ncbi:hypothetical protein G6F35_018119 [Rhizopus arrhizus]|nr:hypothetical protein G6F35_018119 [Rhizopus arrhizus]
MKGWGIDLLSDGNAPVMSPVVVTGDTKGAKQKLDEGERYILQMRERVALLGKETEAEKLHCARRTNGRIQRPAGRNKRGAEAVGGVRKADGHVVPGSRKGQASGRWCGIVGRTPPSR